MKLAGGALEARPRADGMEWNKGKGRDRGGEGTRRRHTYTPPMHIGRIFSCQNSGCRRHATATRACCCPFRFGGAASLLPWERCKTWANLDWATLMLYRESRPSPTDYFYGQAVSSRAHVRFRSNNIHPIHKPKYAQGHKQDLSLIRSSNQVHVAQSHSSKLVQHNVPPLHKNVSGFSILADEVQKRARSNSPSTLPVWDSIIAWRSLNFRRCLPQHHRLAISEF